MKLVSQSSLIYVALFIAAFVLNPSRNSQQLKLKEKFTELNPNLGPIIGKAFRNTLKYKSYYVFSFLSADETPITIGAFGLVWVNEDGIDIK